MLTPKEAKLEISTLDRTSPLSFYDCRYGASTGNILFGDVSVEQLIAALEEVSF